jgi:hypothetical protein
MSAPPLDSVVRAVACAAALTRQQRPQFLRRLKDIGILSRTRRGERYPERNAQIRDLHARDLTPGQIGKLLGMTRDAVRQVLRRSRRDGYTQPTYPMTRPPAVG